MKDIGKVSRREFIATTAAVGACMCGLNGCNILLPQTGDALQIHSSAYEISESNKKVEIIIDTGKAPDLMNVGSAVKIIDSRINDRIIIANTGESDFTALSLSCTHNGAEVEYKHDRKIFKCVSYNRAEFSLDGRSIDSMNLKTLKTYPIRRQNEKLIIFFEV
ncbi:MAG: hypothetical protein KKD92_10965 [Proteobacteria bacterium]|nr:hypothetical protein [Pseudomonadota bacterium]